MLGTVVNAAAIILGGLLGAYAIPSLPRPIERTVTGAIGLSVLLIGVKMAWRTEDIVIPLLSLVLGGLAGEMLSIESRLERLGRAMERWVGPTRGDFTRGFVTATLLFCVGAMAVMGAIEGGLRGDHSILFAKAVLDGTMALVFASTLGIGVALSALPVLLYQGSIALAAGLISSVLSEPMVEEMTATGGIIILGVALNILGTTDIRVGNLLPAVVVAPLLVALWG